MTPAPSAPDRALDRSIGLWQAAALVAGIMIGASIFVQPAEIARHVRGVPAVLAVWLLCGLISFCGALVCAELASAFPRTGGVYVFLKETLSPAVGFLWGWGMFWVMHSGIIAASAVIFGRYVAYFTPLGDAGIRVVAVVAILAISLVNFFGVRQGGALQATVTGAKLLAIAVLLVLFLISPGGHPAPSNEAAELPGLRSFVLALSAGLFTYGGWHMVTYSAGETQDPERTIPRALMIGTLLVTVVYFALNAAYMSVLPADRLVSSTRVAADAASELLGPRAAAAVSLLVLVSAVGVLNGVILAGPRGYLAMARDGLLFSWMAAVHPRYHTPHIALIVQAIWASVLVATGTYRALFTRVIYTEWLFFALMAVGLFRMRRRADYQPRYRVWGYPIVPLIFVLASLAVVANQIAADPRESAFGLLLILIGWPVYHFWARRRPTVDH